MPYIIKIFFVVAMAVMAVALAYSVIGLPGIPIAIAFIVVFQNWAYKRLGA